MLKEFQLSLLHKNVSISIQHKTMYQYYVEKEKDKNQQLLKILSEELNIFKNLQIHKCYINGVSLQIMWFFKNKMH